MVFNHSTSHGIPILGRSFCLMAFTSPECSCDLLAGFQPIKDQPAHNALTAILFSLGYYSICLSVFLTVCSTLVRQNRALTDALEIEIGMTSKLDWHG